MWEIGQLKVTPMPSQALATDREVDDLQHALAAEVIHDVEHPEPPAIGQLIRYEVH